MRVLTLTWEFPPMITGGLGMACYGMVKAMLKQGVKVDLIMPTRGKAYFKLRKAEDVDDLVSTFVNLSGEREFKNPTSAGELRAIIGNPVSVYYTSAREMQTKYRLGNPRRSATFERLMVFLSDDYYLFQQVRHYTKAAVGIGRKIDFDVIHAHDWLSYPAGMILKKLSRRPLVVHVHATEFDRAGGVGDDRIHNVEYMGMEYADRVIAVSGYTARLLAERYHIDPEKIRVVHNAYSMSNSGNNYRRIFKEPTVLFMGRVTLQKGPDYFLEVARRVIQQEKKVRFIMAGSGDMERKVLHRAASFGLGTKFLAAGFLDRQQVESILASADIFVLPSVSEPFGIAPLEAMSHGAVAIVSKYSGVAEVIENAYKIDFWDIDRMVSVIIELIEDPVKFKEMSERGKAEVANLQWAGAAGKVMDVFCELRTERCSI